MAEDGTGVDPAVIEAVREAAEAMGAAASRLEGSTEGTAPGATASREARLAREKTILGQIAGIYQQIETSIKNSFDAGAKLGDSLADMALNADKVDLSLKNVVGSTKSLGSSFMNVGKQLAQMPLVAGEIVKKFAGIATRFGEITAGTTGVSRLGAALSELPVYLTGVGGAAGAAAVGLGAALAVVGALALAIGGLVAITIKFIDAVIKLSISLIDAENAFMRTTGASQQLASQITTTYAEMRRFGVTIEDASGSLNALFKDFKDFTFLNEQQQKTLVQTASILGRLGVAHGDFAKSVEIGTKMMGVSIDQSDEMMLKMRRQAQALGVDVGVLTSQFASGGAAFAKFGATGVDTFVDVARVSKITGMELTKLLNMVNKFDTFDGAAEQAGKLNAMLGGNFVNAMDLMMTTNPVDRFEMIRGAIENAGLSFDTMSYYQRKFYADSLGLDSVGDLALMLSGDMSELSAEVNKTSADYAKQAEEARKLQSAQDYFRTLFVEMTPVIKDVQQGIRDFFEEMNKPENRKAIEDFGSAMFTLSKAVLNLFGVEVKGADGAVAVFTTTLKSLTQVMEFLATTGVKVLDWVFKLFPPLEMLRATFRLITDASYGWKDALGDIGLSFFAFLRPLAFLRSQLFDITSIFTSLKDLILSDTGDSPLLRGIEKVTAFMGTAETKTVDLMTAAVAPVAATAQAAAGAIQFDMTVPVQVGDELVGTMMKRIAVDTVSKTVTQHSLGLD